MEYDIFVSYASEDRLFVSELVTGLKKSGLSVWYDQDILTKQEGHGSIIEDGIIHSRYAVSVISKSYLTKTWTEAEYGAIRKLEMHENRDRIIAILHGAPSSEFGVPFRRSPVKNTISSENGLDFVVSECIRLINEMSKEADLIHASGKGSQGDYVYIFPLGRFSYYGASCPNCGAPMDVGNHSTWCSKCDYMNEMEPV